MNGINLEAIWSSATLAAPPDATAYSANASKQGQGAQQVCSHEHSFALRNVRHHASLVAVNIPDSDRFLQI